MPMKVGNDDFNTNSDDLIIHNIMNKDICTCIFLNSLSSPKTLIPAQIQNKIWKIDATFFGQKRLLIKV